MQSFNAQRLPAESLLICYTCCFHHTSIIYTYTQIYYFVHFLHIDLITVPSLLTLVSERTMEVELMFAARWLFTDMQLDAFFVKQIKRLNIAAF